MSETKYQKFLILALYLSKCGDIADNNPNTADDDERTLSYR